MKEIDGEDIVLQAYQWLNSSAGQGEITLTAAQRHELVTLISAQVDEGIRRPHDFLPKWNRMLQILLKKEQP